MRNRTPVGDEEMLSLPDCRFLTEKGTCGRLNISHCAGEKCKFLNREASHTDINMWSSRLSLRSEEEQMKIARKYYGGKRPWKDGGGDTL